MDKILPYYFLHHTIRLLLFNLPDNTSNKETEKIQLPTMLWRLCYCGSIVRYSSFFFGVIIKTCLLLVSISAYHKPK